MPLLWTAIRLPCLPLEALSPSATEPSAAFERKGNRRLVVCCNKPAEASGVVSGMTLSAATALCPGLREHERRPAAERAALGALSAAAYQVTDQVSVQPTAPQSSAHTVWLEVANSLRMFQGLDALLAKLNSALDRLGYSYILGIAPTLEGASLLASADQPFATDRQQFLVAARRLPLSLLGMKEETTEALRGCGMRTVGEVLALPHSEFAMRFGQDATDYLGRLIGRLPDVRRFYKPPDKYRRYFEFEGELESTGALLFPLRRMLVEFQEYLIARDTGVREFQLELEHADAPSTTVAVGMSAPSRDAAHLLVLLRERMERAPMPGPVRALTLAASRFAAPRVQQRELFVTRTKEDEEWSSVIDRLTARLGAEAVKGLGLADDYRPEKSWCQVPVGSESKIVLQKSRPLWLLPEPRPLVGIPRCVTGPERMEGGWWDGLDVARDYYLAKAKDGARLWVYRDRNTGGWFLQGLWS